MGIQAPITASHVFPTVKMMKLHPPSLSTHHNCTRFRETNNNRFWSQSQSQSQLYVKAAAQKTNNSICEEEEEEEDHKDYSQKIKDDLFTALQGMNRGIFGVPSPKKIEIENLVELLESQNPTPQPTLSLEKVSGAWKLIYSTITILGSKRTKLGLRDFITLGDFLQFINVAEGKAVNVIKFSARAFNLLSGQLTIHASFNIASKSRVDISYNKSVITPHQLMNVFRKNYELLLGIFNPEGWLEITYVDDLLRIGRDDKGNIFILERVNDDDNSA